MSSTQVFRDYVTSTAFSLSLTKPQVEMMVVAHITGDRTGCYVRNFVTTVDALVRRGLLENREGSSVKHGHLSPAGEAVIEVLKVAGIYQETAKRLGFEVDS